MILTPTAPRADAWTRALALPALAFALLLAPAVAHADSPFSALDFGAQDLAIATPAGAPVLTLPAPRSPSPVFRPTRATSVAAPASAPLPQEAATAPALRMAPAEAPVPSMLPMPVALVEAPSLPR